MVILLLSIVLPTQLVSAANISTSNKIDYNDNVPADTATPVKVAPDLSITAGQGELFSGGNLKYELAGGSDSSEKLILPDGDYTIDGQNVKVANGEIFIGSDKVGSVNSSLDGDGKALQIDFDIIPVQNGNFEGGMTGWTINDTNQIFLGNLASKTQARGYTNVQNLGSGQYQVNAPGYSYVTD